MHTASASCITGRRLAVPYMEHQSLYGYDSSCPYPVKLKLLPRQPYCIGMQCCVTQPPSLSHYRSQYTSLWLSLSSTVSLAHIHHQLLLYELVLNVRVARPFASTVQLKQIMHAYQFIYYRSLIINSLN